jgi:hypothetical protein
VNVPDFSPRRSLKPFLLAFWAAVSLVLAAWLLAPAAAHAQASGADGLRAKYNELQAELNAPNMFGAPLHLDSVDSGSRVSGEIYAVMDHPYASVARAFRSPSTWCEMMILHLNTKYCRAQEGQGARAQLTLGIGSKKPESAEKASRLDFNFTQVAAGSDYLRSDLSAGKGPMATSNYHIVLEAIPLGPKRSFLHFSYSYESGVAGRMAMTAYLATAGAGKVGFTVTERTPDGTPKYITGARGVVERNTMRYYLAIDSYLDSLSKPAPEQVEARLKAWFDASEKYARQLHEVDRTAYLDMKRDEVRRQQSLDVSLLQQ